MSNDKVDRYNCTNGGSAYCNGCYFMERDEDGDYVKVEDYEAIAKRVEELESLLIEHANDFEDNKGPLVPDWDEMDWHDRVCAALDEKLEYAPPSVDAGAVGWIWESHGQINFTAGEHHAEVLRNDGVTLRPVFTTPPASAEPRYWARSDQLANVLRMGPGHCAISPTKEAGYSVPIYTSPPASAGGLEKKVMDDQYSEVECYECGRLKTRLIWQSRCVTCTVKKLEFNLDENEKLRAEIDRIQDASTPPSSAEPDQDLDKFVEFMLEKWSYNLADPLAEFRESHPKPASSDARRVYCVASDKVSDDGKHQLYEHRDEHVPFGDCFVLYAAPPASADHAIANASCWDTNIFDPRPEQEANAHLIAAAPDLYEQLDRMIRAYESEIHDKYDGCSSLDAHLEITKDARAALDKARGELTQAAEV